jgi:NDP-sugar pyrophosphorylase family protein
MNIRWPQTMWPLKAEILEEIPDELRPPAAELQDLEYPWQFGSLLQSMLQNRITETRISADAAFTNQRLTDIQGPVWIEDGAVINAFASIVGPSYIGPSAVVGNFTLVRSSILLADSLVGAHGEVGRTVLGNRTKAFHENKLFDSVISADVALAGRVATANCRHDKADVSVQIDEVRVDTGLHKLGAFIGTHASFASGAVTMPGMLVGEGASIFMDARVMRNVSDYGRAIDRQSH